jgi:hypothetical protein
MFSISLTKQDPKFVPDTCRYQVFENFRCLALVDVHCTRFIFSWPGTDVSGCISISILKVIKSPLSINNTVHNIVIHLQMQAGSSVRTSSHNRDDSGTVSV